MTTNAEPANTTPADPLKVRRALAALLREAAENIDIAPLDAFDLTAPTTGMTDTDRHRRTAVHVLVETVNAADSLASALANTLQDGAGHLTADDLARVRSLTRRNLAKAAHILARGSFTRLVTHLADGSAPATCGECTP